MADIVIDGTIGANRLLILDSTGKIPAVDGSQVTTIAAGNIATGTIPIARIDTGSTANKIVVLDGSGRLPAVSAALITNIPGATKSASDPVIATNPSGGVGTEWHNTTSGEVYICTDATAGANVWTNVGPGTGNIEPDYFPGTNYGYMVGGNPANNSPTTDVSRYSYTSDGNASDVSNLATGIRYTASTCSKLAGYNMGGTVSGPDIVDIQKLVFATNANTTDVGNLLGGTQGAVGTSSLIYGYVLCGGSNAGSADYSNRIEKFQFSADGNTTDVADMTRWTYQNTATGNSSATYGYIGGGAGNTAAPYDWVTVWDDIEKHAFASDSNAVVSQDLLFYLTNQANCSSLTYGYVAGGRTAPGNTAMNVIQKFPFASSANATDVGDLTVVGNMCVGTGSETYGYRTGGYGPYTDVIEKWSFSSDGNSTDVGNLPTQQGYGGGSFHF